MMLIKFYIHVLAQIYLIITDWK